jgi:putative peptide zinc metalloprotease protein
MQAATCSTASAPKFRLHGQLRFIPQRSASRWKCVIEDPVHKRYFRLGRREYLIASAFNGQRDLNEILSLLQQTAPELSWTVADIEKVLRWLIHTGLVELATAATGGEIPKASPPPSPSPKPAPATRMLDPFMLRIPCIDGPCLTRWVRPWTFLVSPLGVGLASLILLAGILCGLGSYREIMATSAELFVPASTGWWFLAWLVMKSVHELGHGVVCLRRGGSLRGAGIGLFYLAPVPYVDTTDMWRIPSRRARALCAAGGIWFEMVVAGLAVVVFQLTDDPTLGYFCVTLAVLGSITTLAFNGNPLVRFDGYFILSDLLDRPNLWMEGQQALRQALSRPWAALQRQLQTFEGAWLIVYGGLSSLYRIIMLLALAWGAWNTYRGVGLGLIALAAYVWFIGPKLRIYRERKVYGGPAASPPATTLGSPRLAGRYAVGALVIIVALAGLSRLPSPIQPLTPGYLSYGEPMTVRSPSDGILCQVFHGHGEYVEAGTPLFRLENIHLELEAKELACQVEITQEKCRLLRAQGRMAEYQAELAMLASIHEQDAQVDHKLQQLIVTAPHSGRLLARGLDRLLGQCLKTGQVAATIAGQTDVQVSCSLPQTEVDYYRHHLGESMAVSLEGRAPIRARLTEVRPRGSDILDNPILAARYGGPIGVELNAEADNEQTTIKTLKPRFQARLILETPLAEDCLVGQRCTARLWDSRITIGNVLYRWSDSLWQWLFPSDTDQVA